MTWAEDDAAEMAARRRAAELSNERRALQRSPGLAVPVRALAPGRDFMLEGAKPGVFLYSNATEPGRLDGVGICVEVLAPFTDPGTGEIIGTRYRCRRPGYPWRILPAEEVDTDQIGGVDRSGASFLARWLLRDVANKRHPPWTLTAKEAERIHDAWRLAGAVAL